MNRLLPRNGTTWNCSLCPGTVDHLPSCGCFAVEQGYEALQNPRQHIRHIVLWCVHQG